MASLCEGGSAVFLMLWLISPVWGAPPEDLIQDLVRDLGSSQEMVRSNAASELGKIGEPRKDVLEAFKRVANGDREYLFDSCYSSAKTLRYSEQDLTQLLIARLEAPIIPKLDPVYTLNVQLRVFTELQALGKSAKSAESTLLRLRNEKDLTRDVIDTLIAIGADSDATKQFYANATTHRSEYVRQKARYAIKRLGGSNQASAILDENVYREANFERSKKDIHNADPKLRSQAADELFKVLTDNLSPSMKLTYVSAEHLEARKLLREFAASGSDPDAAIKLVSTSLLMPDILYSPEEAIELARGMAEAPGQKELIAALERLIVLRKHRQEGTSLTPAEALDRYQKELESKDESTVALALSALGRLEAGALSASTAIIKVLEDESRSASTRARAADTLLRIKPDNEEVRFALLAATRSPDSDLRRSAMTALTILVPSATLIPIFISRLDTSSGDILNDALIFLFNQRAASKPATQKFLEKYYAEIPVTSAYARQALENLGLSKEAYRELVVSDAIKYGREEPDRLLASLVKERKEIAKGLIELIENEQDADRKCKLIMSLSLLEKDAEAGAPLLKSLWSSSDLKIRVAVGKALERIGHAPDDLAEYAKPKVVTRSGFAYTGKVRNLKDPERLNVLIEVLRQPAQKGSGHYEALLEIESYGKNAAPTTGFVIPYVFHQWPLLQEASIRALARTADGNQEAVKVLLLAASGTKPFPHNDELTIAKLKQSPKPENQKFLLSLERSVQQHNYDMGYAACKALDENGYDRGKLSILLTDLISADLRTGGMGVLQYLEHMESEAMPAVPKLKIFLKKAPENSNFRYALEKTLMSIRKIK